MPAAVGADLMLRPAQEALLLTELATERPARWPLNKLKPQAGHEIPLSTARAPQRNQAPLDHSDNHYPNEQTERKHARQLCPRGSLPRGGRNGSGPMSVVNRRSRKTSAMNPYAEMMKKAIVQSRVRSCRRINTVVSVSRTGCHHGGQHDPESVLLGSPKAASSRRGDRHVHDQQHQVSNSQPHHRMCYQREAGPAGEVWLALCRTRHLPRKRTRGPCPSTSSVVVLGVQ